MYTIKQLHHSETTNKQILQLGREIFREEDEIPYLKKALKYYIPSLSYIAIGSNNAVIGFILICKNVDCTYTFTKITHQQQQKNSYEIAFLGTSPHYQGYGIGSRLLSHMLERLQSKHRAFTCWLLVDTINRGAIRFYEKTGFYKYMHTKPGETPAPGYIMCLDNL